MLTFIVKKRAKSIVVSSAFVALFFLRKALEKRPKIVSTVDDKNFLDEHEIKKATVLSKAKRPFLLGHYYARLDAKAVTV